MNALLNLQLNQKKKKKSAEHVGKRGKYILGRKKGFESHSTCKSPIQFYEIIINFNSKRNLMEFTSFAECFSNLNIRHAKSLNIWKLPYFLRIIRVFRTVCVLSSWRKNKMCWIPIRYHSFCDWLNSSDSIQPTIWSQ